jgi:hypothetical protein
MVDEVRAVAIPVPVEAGARLLAVGLAGSRVVEARVAGLDEHSDCHCERGMTGRIPPSVVIEIADHERPASSQEITVVPECAMGSTEPRSRLLATVVHRPDGEQIDATS